MRLKIYISGPISNGGTLPQDTRLRNVKNAAEKMAELMDSGFAVLAPQLTEYAERITGRIFRHETWIENDLPWVLSSDAIYRMPGESTGADMEVDFAIANDIPVFFDTKALTEFFKGRM